MHAKGSRPGVVESTHPPSLPLSLPPSLSPSLPPILPPSFSPSLPLFLSARWRPASARTMRLSGRVRTDMAVEREGGGEGGEGGAEEGRGGVGSGMVAV